MTLASAVAIIDDDEPVRDSLSLMLSNHGFGVCSFASAEQFLSALQANELPSCIVCDIRMAHDSARAHYRARRRRHGGGST
jgi:FixJ family two-component response regulator